MLLSPLMNQLLPTSLLPRAQLKEILIRVRLQQIGLEDRLFLAVLIQEIFSYCENKLVTQNEAVNSGLF